MRKEKGYSPSSSRRRRPVLSSIRRRTSVCTRRSDYTGRPRYQRKLLVKPRAHAARARPPRHAMVHVTPRARTDATIRHTVDTPALTSHILRVESHRTHRSGARGSHLSCPVSLHTRAQAAERLTSDRTRIRSISSLHSGFCARRTGQIDLEAVQLQYEELHTSMVHGSDRSASARLTPTNPCAAPAGGCLRGPRTGRRASSVRCAAHP